MDPQRIPVIGTGAASGTATATDAGPRRGAGVWIGAGLVGLGALMVLERLGDAWGWGAWRPWRWFAADLVLAAIAALGLLDPARTRDVDLALVASGAIVLVGAAVLLGALARRGRVTPRSDRPAGSA